MRVIPVIDLLGGEVVRGVGGRRETYRRVESRLTRDVSPGGVARAFAQALPVDAVYVADLDALAGREPRFADHEAICASGLALWLDAGVGSASRARELLAWRGAGGAAVERLLAPLESLADERALAEVFEAAGPARAMFSLDMRQGELLTSAPAWRGQTPLQVARLAARVGFRAMLLLDLGDVGERGGSRLGPLCQAVRQACPAVELYAGGGVRNARDLRALESAGAHGALVATALHELALTRADLE